LRTLASPEDRPIPSIGDTVAWRLVILFGTLLFAGLISLGSGPAKLSSTTLLDALTGSGDAGARAIVLELRLPRTLLAIIVGGGLAASGASFQALLRNPLAEPYVLGISGGAAVGAVAAVVTGLASATSWGLPLAAFIGAISTVALVFWIAIRVGRGFDSRIMLLAGVVVGAFFNAVILLLLTYANPDDFRSAVLWMMGSLATASWTSAAVVALYILPMVAILVGLARGLNLVAMGDDAATYLGIRVDRMKAAAFVVASVIVAAAVAVCGVIGFIGLIVPHALRLIWGGDHRFLLPGCFLAGGAFLLLTDTAARTVAAPAELPIGVITALAGVPLFVFLLTRSMR
jgi:iron complex transport system permease protein